MEPSQVKAYRAVNGTLAIMIILGLAFAGTLNAQSPQMIPILVRDGREYASAATLATVYQIGLKSLPGRTEFTLCHQDRCALVNAVVTELNENQLVGVEALAKALGAESVFDSGRKSVGFTFSKMAGISPGVPQAGSFAPHLTLKTLDGKPVSLADFRGRRVLINSWASWCGCRNDLPAWQAFYQKHRDHNFEILSVAVDVQGAKVVRPYVEMADVTFTVAVDEADVLGRAFGLKLTPVSILVDELGIIRAQGGGPRKDFLEQVEAVIREPLSKVSTTVEPVHPSDSVAELEQKVAASPEDWRARTELAERLVAEKNLEAATKQLDAASRLKPDHADLCFLNGRILLQQGKNEEALEQFRKARELDPQNWRIRKQIWAIEHPDKFYTARNPDYRWQKEALSKERTANTPAAP